MTTLLPAIFTMEEAADYLRISRRQLQEIIKDRPFYRQAGRRNVAGQVRALRSYCHLCPQGGDR